MMDTKLCEKCNVNYFEVTVHNRKYCDECKPKYRLPVKIGIYKITNTVNDKTYIGQSLSILNRINGHKYHLRRNTHQNEHLQNAVNKYGLENFKFEIIEECQGQELNEREIYWMNYYESFDYNKGYNITKPSIDGIKFSMSEESKRKSSESKTIYTNDELISYLQEYFYHFGKVPTTRNLIETDGFPSNVIFFKRFGSYKNALIEAGLFDYCENKDDFDKPIRTKDEIISLFKKFVEKHGRFPVQSEMRSGIKHGLPSLRSVSNHFYKLQDLKDVLGFTKENIIKEENEQAILMLKEFYIKNGSVSSRDLLAENNVRCAKFYSDRFGSLENAYKLAGIPYQKYFIKYE